MFAFGESQDTPTFAQYMGLEYGTFPLVGGRRFKLKLTACGVPSVPVFPISG